MPVNFVFVTFVPMIMLSFETLQWLFQKWHVWYTDKLKSFKGKTAVGRGITLGIHKIFMLVIMIYIEAKI